MTEFEFASLMLRGLVGIGQIGIVGFGILVMHGMNKERTRQAEAQMEAQQRQAEAQRRQAEAQMEAQQRQAEAQRRQAEAQMEAQQRQAEAQRAEAEQREKRADQRHAEAMRALDAVIKGMDQQAETLRAAVKGMETVIERTAPPRDTP